jgi:hypothetical protein
MKLGFFLTKSRFFKAVFSSFLAIKIAKKLDFLAKGRTYPICGLN